MQKNNNITKHDRLPDNFETLDEFMDFWDTHSSADYEQYMEDVDFEIDLQSSKMYCPIEKTVMKQIRHKAISSGLSAETLVNMWLQEKLLLVA